ncbi:hypothetical protein [Sphingobacterium anhuiense]|uniref:hypothetical protein n=1 Tax=Sphingobacterium anhuiense TaxID=493780 RepID=UPI003C3021E1
MAIRTYEFDYLFGEASATIVIDTEIFTEERALEVLEFFVWDWDRNADPITEAAKKYALTAIRIATAEGYNTFGVKDEFNSMEGYYPFGQKYGIQLKEVEQLEFHDLRLDFELGED